MYSNYVLPDKVIQQQQQHPLLKDLYVCHAGYYPAFQGHFTQRPTGLADAHILIYCLDGEGWYESEGIVETIHKGQLLFILKGVPHSYGANIQKPWTIQWVHFDGLQAELFLDLLNITSQKSSVTIGEHFTIVRLFREIFGQLQRGYSSYLLINVAAQLRQILSQVAMQNAFIPTNQKGLDIEAMIHFMLEHLSANMTVQAFADQAKLSKAHFSRLFFEKTGYAPMDYFIRLKIQKGCELLNQTDLLIQEISQQLGYQDPYYFSRIFSKVIGLSPKAYRAQRDFSI